jgi:[ribosomal protein S18]-alanine N-acetyltransferase
MPGKADEAGPRIGPAAQGDLDRIVAILEASFPSPWTRAMMVEELERPVANVWVLRPGPGADPAAFVDFWHVADEIHVLNVATWPAARRLGHARCLLEAVLSYGRERGVRTVSLELRRGNAAARHLYASLGFEALGIRPRYYADNGEDAVVMVRRMGQG